ncbi:MAG: flagellar FliJ family protein [Pyrinomonadaceae bacterium]
MTKGRYRLQPVLDVRAKAKEDAVRHVALRRNQLREAEEELARRVGELARCRGHQQTARAAMLGAAERGAAARLLAGHRTHLADLRRQESELLAAVDEQRAAVARAEREVEGALAVLAEASKEHRVIEKHRENWREAERLGERRREQKLGDEIASVLRRRGDG